MERYKKLGEEYARLRSKVDRFDAHASYSAFFDLYSEIVRAHNQKRVSEYEYEFLTNILMAKEKGVRK